MSLTSANYNVTGNPSITSNFILTPTDENSYITSSVSTPANSEFDIYTKVTAIDLQGVVGTYFLSILMSSNPTTSVSVGTQFRYPHIFTAVSNIEGVQDSTSTYGPSISANTDYWIRLHVSSPATHKLTLYAIADDNYTRDTLPSTGWYVSQDIDVSSSIYTGRQVRLGWGNLISESNPASISMDLKETFISVQGNVIWEAVQTISSLPSKGYTNYTIIGDPTYSDGVYSDFRHDRYIQFPQDLKGTDKTYIVKFTTASIAELLQGRQFIVNNFKFFTLCLYEGYVCLLDWAANPSNYIHLFAPATNTTYYVKAAYNGLTVTVSHSMDGTSWVQDLQYTYSELVTSKDQYGFSVGNHPVWTTSAFRGSIDFNDFYVLDTATQKVLWMPSTKPISIVADYTVVGSPTISDDYIASGFGSSNYIQIPETIRSADTSWEVNFSFVSTNLGSYNLIFGCTNSNNSVLVGVGGSKLLLWLSSNGSSWNIVNGQGSTSISTNTKYYIKLVYDGTKYVLSYSTDGQNYSVSTTVNDSTAIADNKTLYLGATFDRGSGYLRGSSDLNDFYIIRNGAEVWRAVKYVQDTPDYGSISISNGYYNNGVNAIQMPSQTIQAGSLKNGQIPGNRTKAYAVSSSGVASVRLVGNDATEQALQGTYDVYTALSQPVYMSHAENYLISGDAGGISQAEFSYTSGGDTVNYTVVGSPTISENFVASNFSSTSYVTSLETFNPGSSPWEVLVKVKTGASVSSEINIIGYSSDQQGFRLGLAGTSAGKWQLLVARNGSWINTSSHYGSYSVQANTEYWLKAGFTGTQYYLKYSLDGETFIQDVSYSSSSVMTIPSNPEMRIGAGYLTPWNGSIDLTNLQVTIGDSVWWRAVVVAPASVTIPKAFWYDSTGHNSYWYPQSVTVSLADAKAEQTVGDVNRVFVTNELGQDLSGITLAEEEVVGDYTTSAPVPLKNAYLDHDTNSYILGVQKDPDEIVVEASFGGGGTITNYTVVGSPTISDNYIASGFSSSSYITTPLSTPTTSLEVTCKVILPSSVSSSGDYPCTLSVVDILTGGIIADGGAFKTHIGSTNGQTLSDTKVWLRFVINNSQADLYILEDATDSYSLNNLPDIASWTYEGKYNGNNLFSYITDLSLGLNTFRGSTANWEIDLKGVMYVIDGTTTWVAVESAGPAQVSIGTSDNWTALQNRTYWYEEGDTTAVSALTSDTYEADLKGYIIFSEDANEDLIVKGYTSAYTVTTYNTPDVYSGYSYTVTDSTGSTLDTFTKTGTLCKAYTMPAMAGLKFVFIPAEDLEDGHVYEAGDIREAYSETNGTPFRQLDVSTEDYTYDAFTDTLTDENEGELTSIGHVYVEWNDIAE